VTPADLLVNINSLSCEVTASANLNARIALRAAIRIVANKFPSLQRISGPGALFLYEWQIADALIVADERCLARDCTGSFNSR